MRQMLRQFCQFYLGSRVSIHLALLHHPAKKSASRLHFAAHRCRTAAFRSQMHHPRAQIGRSDALRVKRLLVGCEKICQLAQIERIGLHREGRKISLILEILQKPTDFHSTSVFWSSHRVALGYEFSKHCGEKQKFEAKKWWNFTLFLISLHTLYIERHG